MTIHDHRGSRRHDPIRKASAEELAAVRRLGLTWREEWRAEQAASIERANGAAAARREANGGGGFAEAIARAEFGRFYWNDRLDGQLRSAMRPRPRDDASRRHGKSRK